MPPQGCFPESAAKPFHSGRKPCPIGIPTNSARTPRCFLKATNATSCIVYSMGGSPCPRRWRTDRTRSLISGCRAMSYGSWETMIGDWPELHHLAHLVEAAKQARRDERILRLGKGTAEMRVAYALLEFCIRLAPDCGSECYQFHIPLTQQQLGDYVGLSSVHVCRTMRRMVRNGILEMHDHMDIRILDAPSLARLAGVDIEDLKREIVPARK